jgi:acetoin utilization deacetylase AcuC-like enzyme
LDLDYHAGNGTQDIFDGRNDIMRISIHADPKYDYPSFSGYATENTKTNINIIFDKKCPIDKYILYVSTAMFHINQFDPDVLIIPLGTDTLKTDPDASKLYGANLETNDFITIGKLIKNTFNKNIIVTQEGGYDLDNVPTAVHNFLLGISL